MAFPRADNMQSDNDKSRISGWIMDLADAALAFSRPH